MGTGKCEQSPTIINNSGITKKFIFSFNSRSSQDIKTQIGSRLRWNLTNKDEHHPWLGDAGRGMKANKERHQRLRDASKYGITPEEPLNPDESIKSFSCELNSEEPPSSTSACEWDLNAVIGGIALVGIAVIGIVVVGSALRVRYNLQGQ